MSGELGVLLLADARLPTGAHAHSAGLEPAIRAGLTLAEVPRFIDGRLRTVGWMEAAAAVLARRCAGPTPGDLAAVQEALLARMPSAPQRAASGLLGRGLARLARRLWPDEPAVAALAAVEGPVMRPVALGVVAAVVGMGDAQVARASLYDDVQTVTAAALKLLPVDPAATTRWVLDAAPVLEETADRAVQVSGADQMPSPTTPLIEQHSLEHDARSRRIFVA